MINFDQYGVNYVTDDDLCGLLYENPNIDISSFNIIDPSTFNKSNTCMYAGYPALTRYEQLDISLEQFDKINQSNWKMPVEYKEMDIAAYVLSLCKEQHELQRVGQELLLYQEKNAFNLLKYLKYLVDTMRENDIIWGVGRGSSVASYVLFLIGVHKIDSLYYDLPIEEFFKENGKEI